MSARWWLPAALTPDEQDKFCSNCGARNSMSASYCAGCGKSLG